MHSAKCPEIAPRGAMATIIAPNNSRTFASGTDVNAGVNTATPNQALVFFSLGGGTAALYYGSNDAPALVIGIESGRHTRVVLPQAVTRVLITSNSGGVAWTEDLSALAQCVGGL